MTTTNNAGNIDRAERRRTARKRVFETFHVFLVVPKSGLRRIYLKDVSEGGLGFFAEATDRFGAGDTLDCHFYINPSLKLPLAVRVAHVTEAEGERLVGCEFADTSSRAFKAYVGFLKLLDDLAAFVEG